MIVFVRMLSLCSYVYCNVVAFYSKYKYDIIHNEIEDDSLKEIIQGSHPYISLIF